MKIFLSFYQQVFCIINIFSIYVNPTIYIPALNTVLSTCWYHTEVCAVVVRAEEGGKAAGLPL